MKVAVASGKGGTGKTTVSLNLAKVCDFPVQLLDCDVEEPDAHLFLPGPVLHHETVTVPIPRLDEKRCDACGECSEFCQFHAIVSLKTKPLIFPDLCHGCGGCMMVCPQQAIRETERQIGVIEERLVEHISLIHGRLDVGVASATPLVRAVKSHLEDSRLAILDAPPGTACPVVATIRETDFVLLVTEPTPFGLHDLTLAIHLVKELQLPFAVVINRVGVGDDRVHEFCKDRDIPIFLEIPDDRRIAEAYSRGELLVETLPEYRELFEELLSRTVESVEAATK